MSAKLCQGPKCHTYRTKDRIRGPKGDKHYETRKIKHTYYFEAFCSQRCYYDWFNKFGKLAVDHFGRLREPIKLTPENAWVKDYTWRTDDLGHRHYFLNKLTNERIPLTEAQWRDSTYTIERARQT